LKRAFGGFAFKHPFRRRNPSVAVEKINTMVAEATEGKITDLLPPGKQLLQLEQLFSEAVVANSS